MYQSTGWMVVCRGGGRSGRGALRSTKRRGRRGDGGVRNGVAGWSSRSNRSERREQTGQDALMTKERQARGGRGRAERRVWYRSSSPRRGLCLAIWLRVSQRSIARTMWGSRGRTREERVSKEGGGLTTGPKTDSEWSAMECQSCAFAQMARCASHPLFDPRPCQPCSNPFSPMINQFRLLCLSPLLLPVALWLRVSAASISCRSGITQWWRHWRGSR